MELYGIIEIKKKRFTLFYFKYYNIFFFEYDSIHYFWILKYIYPYIYISII